MNKKPKLYFPIIIGVVIIIIAMIFIFGCERNEPRIEITEDNQIIIQNSTNSAPSNPTTTDSNPVVTSDNNMPPAEPSEPLVPEVPSTPVYESTNAQNGLQCVDSDGGINYTAIGKVTLTENGSVTLQKEDYCRSVTTKWKGYVFEYYCNDTVLASSQYKCPKGCSGGKCN